MKWSVLLQKKKYKNKINHQIWIFQFQLRHKSRTKCVSTQHLLFTAQGIAASTHNYKVPTRVINVLSFWEAFENMLHFINDLNLQCACHYMCSWSPSMCLTYSSIKFVAIVDFLKIEKLTQIFTFSPYLEKICSCDFFSFYGVFSWLSSICMSYTPGTYTAN